MAKPEPEVEVYAPGAFDGQVGKTVPVKVDGEVIGTGLVVAADERGLTIEMTVTKAGVHHIDPVPLMQSMSFRFPTDGPDVRDPE